MKRAGWNAWMIALTIGGASLWGCAAESTEMAEPDPGPELAGDVDPSPERIEAELSGAGEDGAGALLTSGELEAAPVLSVDDLGPLDGEPARPPGTEGSCEVDERAPELQARWTDETLAARDANRLALELRNYSGETRAFALVLVHDNGTSDAQRQVIGRLEVPSHRRVSQLVPPAALAPALRRGEHPGLLRVVLESIDGAALPLPAFYTRAAADRSPGLLVDEDLEGLDDTGDPEEPTTITTRVVSWAPTSQELPRVEEPESGDVAASSAALSASEYRTCIRWQAQTTDSGNGEDRLGFANSSTALVTAYGVRIRVSQGTWGRTLDTSPTSGCVNWTSPRSGSFSIRVYAYVKDANDNMIRYHNGTYLASGGYPGQTYSALVQNYTPTLGGTTTVSVGSWTPRYTAMAAASMLSRYFPGYTTDTETHMADTSSTGSSATIMNGDARVRLETVSWESRRRKFTVAHELGHARALLRSTGNPVTSAKSGLASGTCNNGSGYTMTSREWNSIPLREGYAHFVAAWTFNFSSESNGTFRWFDETYDVENNAPALTGGHIGNNCGGVTAGQATNLDGLRTLWDWSTPVGGSNRAERKDVSDTYLAMRLAQPAKDAWWEAFLTASEGVASSGEASYLQSVGTWNGMD